MVLYTELLDDLIEYNNYFIYMIIPFSTGESIPIKFNDKLDISF
jgi:hypothetical protein